MRCVTILLLCAVLVGLATCADPKAAPKPADTKKPADKPADAKKPAPIPTEVHTPDSCKKIGIEIDANKDGKFDHEDLKKLDTHGDGVLRKLDVDKNGKIDEKDLKHLDVNKDGKLTNDDIAHLDHDGDGKIHKDDLHKKSDHIPEEHVESTHEAWGWLGKIMGMDVKFDVDKDMVE